MDNTVENERTGMNMVQEGAPGWGKAMFPFPFSLTKPVPITFILLNILSFISHSFLLKPVHWECNGILLRLEKRSVKSSTNVGCSCFYRCTFVLLPLSAFWKVLWIIHRKSSPLPWKLQKSHLFPHVLTSLLCFLFFVLCMETEKGGSWLTGQ